MWVCPSWNKYIDNIWDGEVVFECTVHVDVIDGIWSGYLAVFIGRVNASFMVTWLGTCLRGNGSVSRRGDWYGFLSLYPVDSFENFVF